MLALSASQPNGEPRWCVGVPLPYQGLPGVPVCLVFWSILPPMEEDIRLSQGSLEDDAFLRVGVCSLQVQGVIFQNIRLCFRYADAIIPGAAGGPGTGSSKPAGDGAGRDAASSERPVAVVPGHVRPTSTFRLCPEHLCPPRSWISVSVIQVTDTSGQHGVEGPVLKDQVPWVTGRFLHLLAGPHLLVLYNLKSWVKPFSFLVF